MHSMVSNVVQNQKTVFGLLGLFFFTYFFTMDTILYVKFQAVELWKEKKVDGDIWSPFKPLSAKIIMSDHVTHYILTPMSEYFNHITKFSEIFYFITPNMISFTHLFVGFLSAKFVYSESLHNRRIGVLLFEFRIFLDAFDGTVYRARAGTTVYSSNHSNLGFWIDSVCDTASGFMLCFAILFYFWWKWNPSKEDPSLPWVQENDSSKLANEKHTTEKIVTKPSKRFIFMRCLVYGLTVGFSSGFWDTVVGKCDAVFMKELSTPELQELQSTALHSNTTWVIMWLWRVLSGQALLQMVLVALFIDKEWDFLRIFQYVGFVIVGLLVLVSEFHIHHIRQMLGIPNET